MIRGVAGLDQMCDTFRFEWMKQYFTIVNYKCITLK